MSYIGDLSHMSYIRDIAKAFDENRIGYEQAMQLFENKEEIIQFLENSKRAQKELVADALAYFEQREQTRIVTKVCKTYPSAPRLKWCKIKQRFVYV